MRRGFFVSLAAVLLIGIILISVIAAQEREEAQTELDLMNLENRIAANYIEVLTDVTIPREIAKAAKTELPDANNRAQLSAWIGSDAADEINDEHERLNLPFERVEVSGISITDWRHTDPWTIELDYEYDLEADSARGINWSVSDQTGSLELSIVGFEHREFDTDEYGNITREFWGINSSGNTECYLGLKGYACGTTEQVCPYAYPECRN